MSDNSTNTNNSSNTISSNDSNTSSHKLLLDAFEAYLSPLLKKHSAGQVLVYDDLLQAWDAAQSVLVQHPNQDAVSRLLELHQSQLQAYQAQARKALYHYAKTMALPDLQQEQNPPLSEHSYVDACLQTIVSPGWNVPEDVWEESCVAIVRERAKQVFGKQPSSQPEQQPPLQLQTHNTDESTTINKFSSTNHATSANSTAPPASKTKMIPKKKKQVIKTGRKNITKKGVAGTATNTVNNNSNKTVTKAGQPKGRKLGIRAKRGGGGIGGNGNNNANISK